MKKFLRLLKPQHPIFHQGVLTLITSRKQWLLLVGAIGLLVAQFAFQAKSVILLNSVVEQIQSQQTMGWRLIVMYLLAQFCIVPGLQHIVDVMLTNITIDMWGELVLRVYRRIRNGRLGNPREGGYETQVTSQPDNYAEGLGGQKALLLNAVSILAAAFNVEVLLGWRVGLLMAGVLVIYWVLVDNTLGRGHAQAVAQARAAKSYVQRLIRHLVRPDGRLYHRLHEDTNAQSFLQEKLKRRVTTAKDEALKANIFNFVLKVGIAALMFIVFLITVNEIKVAAFVTFLTQSKDLIGAFGNLIEAVTDSQSIEYAQGRLDPILSQDANPQFAGLNGPEHRKLRENLKEIALTQVNLVDPETSSQVLRIGSLVLLPGITIFYGPRGAGKTPLCYLLSCQLDLGVGDGTIQFDGVSGSEILFRRIGEWPMPMGRLNYNLDETLAATLGEPSNFPANSAWRAAASKLSSWLGIARPLPFDSPMVDVTGKGSGSTTPFSPEEMALLALMRAIITVLAEDLAVLILDQYFDQYISVSTMRKVAPVLNEVVKREHGPNRFVFITTDRPPSELTGTNRTGLNVDRIINLRLYDPMQQATGVQQCSNCKLPVLPGAKFCSECGQQI